MNAIDLIRKYEGFNEKAYLDPYSEGECYAIGYGTQFYPDGSPVKRGQCCSKEKALEYLYHETSVIELQLLKLNLGLDEQMNQALISFIHSIGWEPFLYSRIIDCIEMEDFPGASREIGCWVFDHKHKIIPELLERRREEIDLFLQDVEDHNLESMQILTRAFRSYSAAPHQINAICKLEQQINPYVLSEFANNFKAYENPWIDFDEEEVAFLFSA